MTPEQRARIVAEGAAYAAEIMPPLTDEQADAIAEALAAPGQRAAIDAAADKIAANWPPLTEAQRAKLARIFAQAPATPARQERPGSPATAG